MGVLTLYHYTTEKNLEAIQMSRVINISEGGRDAHFGKGVYLTSLSPEEGERKIARNNFDGRAWARMLQRVQCAIKLKIPDENVQRVAAGDRDIFIHADPIDLNNYRHEFLTLSATVEEGAGVAVLEASQPVYGGGVGDENCTVLFCNFVTTGREY